MKNIWSVSEETESSQGVSDEIKSIQGVSDEMENSQSVSGEVENSMLFLMGSIICGLFQVKWRIYLLFLMI